MLSRLAVPVAVPEQKRSRVDLAVGLAARHGAGQHDFHKPAFA